MRSAAADRRIRAARPAKHAVDPWRPLGVLWERERLPGPWSRGRGLAASPGADDPGTGTAQAPVASAGPGSAEAGVVEALTVFLAGAECAFTCVFCDLWRATLDGPTPPGSLPAQLASALAGEPPARLAGALVKLYNASNFFDGRAVPEVDEPALVELVAPFARVVVESHPRLIGRRCLRFAAALGGRLEVAMGLETIHPAALRGLNKGMTLDDFERAAARLAAAGVGLRAFVLVGAPFVPAEAAVEWAVRSAQYAFERGAGTVALIPVRGGNGALEDLAARGEFAPPALAQLEEALDRCLALGRGVAVADLWDLARLARCPACAGKRRARLERINLSGRPEPRVACGACGGE